MRRPFKSALFLGAVLLGLLADVWLVRRPVPHSVAEFNPFVTRLGKQELTLTGLKTESGAFLDYQGRNALLEVTVEKGALSEKTTHMLAAVKPPAANELNVISYLGPGDVPKTDSGPPPCTSSLRISLESPTAADVHVFQSGIPGGSGHRELEIKATGSRLITDLFVAMDDPSQLPPAGCERVLIIGDSWSHPLAGRPVQIVAAPESAVRVKFMPASSTPLWKDDELFAPFDTSNLKVRTLLISPPGSHEIDSFVQAAVSGPLLDLTNLQIGSDSVRAVLSGQGWVTIDGHPIGPLFSEWIAASYPRAALLSLLETALLSAGVWWMNRKPHVTVLTPIDENRRDVNPVTGLRVFLCHCSEDKDRVRQLRERLQAESFVPWLDEDDLEVGPEWEYQIRQTLNNADAVIICLSKKFVVKTGYVQKELHIAVDLALYRPFGSNYLVPIRLEECTIPPNLAALECADLYREGGFKRLKDALHKREQQLRPETVSNGAAAETAN